MVVCQYFLRGKCSFGDKCRNEHPQGGDKQSAFGSSGFSATGGSFGSFSVNNTPQFTKESLKKDLTGGVEGEKPLWPLTSYGPAKHDPTLVTELDESAEELRVKAAEAFKVGSMNEYMKYEADKIAAANQAYTQLLGKIDQVYDIAVQRKVIPSGVIQENTSAFGGGGGGSAFGQPSAFGGGSAFGQSSLIKPATGAFSQLSGGGGSSAFGGGNSGSAFGQPSIIKPASGAFGPSGGGAFSAFAGSGAAAFGSGSNETGSGGGAFSAFSGPPSAFGAEAPNTTGGSFGTPAPATSAFGTPAPATSAFGAPAPATSAFGTPAPATSAFGAPAQATSAFGAPAQETPSVSTFGTSATTNTSAFGAPVPATSAFGQPSVFGAPAQPTSAFGSAPVTNPPGSVFGSNGGGSAFNQGTGGSAFGQSSNVFSAFSNPNPNPNPSVIGDTTHSGSAFPPPKPPPTSPPNFTNVSPSPYKPGMTKYDGMLPENYLSLLPVAVKAAFESSKFEWGMVPEWVPPKELR